MVHIVDVYATIADLIGIDAIELDAISPNTLDSQSFRHVLAGRRGRGRQTLFAEGFAPNFPPTQDPCVLTFSRALRNRQYKLIRTTNLFNCAGPALEEMYDLGADPLEVTDLLAAGAHLVPGAIRDNYFALAGELDLIPLP